MGAPTKRGRLRRLLPGRTQREPGDAFEMGVGYYHEFTPAEISAIAQEAGLSVTYLSTVNDTDTWPHAVLMGQDASPLVEGSTLIRPAAVEKA
jgi:hypothetical protein